MVTVVLAIAVCNFVMIWLTTWFYSHTRHIIVKVLFKGCACFMVGSQANTPNYLGELPITLCAGLLPAVFARGTQEQSLDTAGADDGWHRHVN
jgi:hypothetical protein